MAAAADDHHVIGFLEILAALGMKRSAGYLLAEAVTQDLEGNKGRDHERASQAFEWLQGYLSRFRGIVNYRHTMTAKSTGQF